MFKYVTRRQYGLRSRRPTGYALRRFRAAVNAIRFVNRARRPYNLRRRAARRQAYAVGRRIGGSRY